MPAARSSRKDASQFRVRCRVGVATRVGGGLGFHELDAVAIGVINIERPFAVSADFRFVLAEEPVGAKFRVGGLDVGDPQGEMILYPEFLVVSAGGYVQHEF